MLPRSGLTRPRTARLAARILLGVPIAVLLLFAIGEMAAGDLGGSQHFVQAAPLVVLLAAAWRFPREVGAILVVLGTVLFVVWLVFVLTIRESPGGFPILGWVAAAVVLFGPPLAAGWLLLRSTNR